MLSLASRRPLLPRLVVFSGAVVLATFLPTQAGAMCDPESPADAADIAGARAVIAETCDCSAASTHGSYVSCAAHTANENLVNKSCMKFVKKCASRSTCGKPGFVTCCITNEKGTKCKTSRDELSCTDKGGVVSGCSSCCDACPAPGSGVSCEVPPSTTTTLAPPTTAPTTTLP